MAKSRRLFGVVALGLFLPLPYGCGGGGGGGGTSKGQAALFLKDASITTSDNRQADQVNVEILRIQLERAEGEDAQDGGDDGRNNDGSNDRHGDQNEEADGGTDVTVFNEPAGSGISVNLLSLDVPVLLTMANIPTGTYEEAELRLNPANATIHFTDGTTAPLLIAQEGEDDAELEFEFFPLLTVSSSGVSNAVIDFAPVVTLSGSDYILGHDHDNDNTGEVENVDEAEVEGSFVSQNGDDITLDVNGKTVHVDISSGGTEFKVADAAVDKSAFLAALSQNVEVKAEGQFSNDALIARQVEIKNENEGGHHGRR